MWNKYKIFLRKAKRKVPFRLRSGGGVKQVAIARNSSYLHWSLSVSQYPPKTPSLHSSPSDGQWPSFRHVLGTHTPFRAPLNNMEQRVMAEQSLSVSQNTSSRAIHFDPSQSYLRKWKCVPLGFSTGGGSTQMADKSALEYKQSCASRLHVPDKAPSEHLSPRLGQSFCSVHPAFAQAPYHCLPRLSLRPPKTWVHCCQGPSQSPTVSQ